MSVWFFETVWPETVIWFEGIWKFFTDVVKWFVDLGILFYVFAGLLIFGAITMVFIFICDAIIKSILLAILLEIFFGFFSETFGFLDVTLQDWFVSIEKMFTDFDTWWEVDLPKDMAKFGEDLLKLFEDFIYKEERQKERFK